MPLKVWKQVSRKMDVSSTSSPVRWADDKPRLDGVRDLVIAWTLSIEMRIKEGREDKGGRYP